MRFIGTVFMVIVVLGLALLTLSTLMQDIFWPVFILVAVLIAIALQMYQELSDRIDRIEQHLGIKDEEAQKTFTEQLKDGEE